MLVLLGESTVLQCGTQSHVVWSVETSAGLLLSDCGFMNLLPLLGVWKLPKLNRLAI